MAYATDAAYGAPFQSRDGCWFVRESSDAGDTLIRLAARDDDSYLAKTFNEYTAACGPCYFGHAHSPRLHAERTAHKVSAGVPVSRLICSDCGERHPWDTQCADERAARDDEELS